jgi:hypothetical protein
MRFVVRFLRYRGRVLPWRDAMNQPSKYGDLRIEECLDGDLRRYVRTARLFDEAKVLPSNGPPELLDVRLMAMSQQGFTLIGFGSHTVGASAADPRVGQPRYIR